METSKRLFRLERSEIAFVKFIFEAYEGIATLTTIDREMGLVRLTIAPGCEEMVSDIMKDLQSKVRIEPWRPAVKES